MNVVFFVVLFESYVILLGFMKLFIVWLIFWFCRKLRFEILKWVIGGLLGFVCRGGSV